MNNLEEFSVLIDELGVTGMQQFKQALVNTQCTKLNKIIFYNCGLDENCMFELSKAITIANIK